ncbi:uncharacterized protein LOC122748559 [Dromiciops gliroides]|uniref:uncharacterized protein LOC122748559 n=1 Tax=Dromiciops gliroides TaxID=33562 RepID=UPI001CC43D09|nr:uncharacterized protein LOC122748559 [Dromiciops gliroides]
MLWKHRGFLTSSGKEIAHSELIRDFLEAIQLPKTLAIIHCSAHKKGTDPVTQGNARADAAAKTAAIEGPVYVMPLQASGTGDDDDDAGSKTQWPDLIYDDKEVDTWKQRYNAKEISGIWYCHFRDHKGIIP